VSALIGNIAGLMKILAIEDGDGAILPTWTAVDSKNVRTSRELWAYMSDECGWHVEVSTAITSSDLDAQNRVQ